MAYYVIESYTIDGKTMIGRRYFNTKWMMEKEYTALLKRFGTTRVFRRLYYRS